MTTRKWARTGKPGEAAYAENRSIFFPAYEIFGLACSPQGELVASGHRRHPPNGQAPVSDSSDIFVWKLARDTPVPLSALELMQVELDERHHRIRYPTERDRNYRIESSPDLIQWTLSALPFRWK